MEMSICMSWSICEGCVFVEISFESLIWVVVWEKEIRCWRLFVFLVLKKDIIKVNVIGSLLVFSDMNLFLEFDRKSVLKLVWWLLFSVCFVLWFFYVFWIWLVVWRCCLLVCFCLWLVWVFEMVLVVFEMSEGF